jgi:putative N-acetylmannosamine-6-phosphate epimerase
MLKITPVEEAQWGEVAATMRENAKQMDQAIDKRSANAANATAIDDLNAYADIAQIHANGVKNLATTFSGLYSAMSDDQKKIADKAFTHRSHEVKRVASR